MEPTKPADTKTHFWQSLLSDPKALLRMVVVIAALVGYDLTIPAGRISDAREKLDEANKRIDDLEKLIGDIKDTQIKTLDAVKK